MLPGFPQDNKGLLTLAKHEDRLQTASLEVQRSALKAFRSIWLALMRVKICASKLTPHQVLPPAPDRRLVQPPFRFHLFNYSFLKELITIPRMWKAFHLLSQTHWPLASSGWMCKCFNLWVSQVLPQLTTKYNFCSKEQRKKNCLLQPPWTQTALTLCHFFTKCVGGQINSVT